MTTRVLVVEDDELVRTFLKDALDYHGYDASTAVDAADALRIIEAHPRFDVFVIDLVMPGLRGDELARRIRRINRAAKVVFLTGYVDEDFRSQELSSDDAFLEKPVSIQALLDTLLRLMADRA